MEASTEADPRAAAGPDGEGREDHNTLHWEMGRCSCSGYSGAGTPELVGCSLMSHESRLMEPRVFSTFGRHKWRDAWSSGSALPKESAIGECSNSSHGLSYLFCMGKVWR